MIQSTSRSRWQPGYDGDITIGSDDAAVKTVLANNEDFKLYLLGEGSYTAPEGDAVIDKSTIGATSGKDVVVKGGLNINGINTIIAGIYFSLENRIKITGGSDVTIYGTKEDDGVNVTLEGDGNNLTADTGEGNDKITVETAKEEGDDSTTDFKNVLKVIAGSGKDSITVNHAAGVLEADIEAGNGDDTAEFKAGSDAKCSYTKSGENGSDDKTISGSLTADMGAGDDMLTIDASLGNAFEEVTAKGNEGYNTLNFSGELKADGKLKPEDGTVDESADASVAPVLGKVTKNADGIYTGWMSMIASGCTTAVKTVLDNFSVLLDSLTNKPTVALDKLNTGDIKSFVNYTFDPKKETGYDDDSYEGMSGNWSDAGDLVLTNLLINPDRTVDTVKIKNLNIPNVTLKVKGQKIVINGAVIANAISLIAEDSDLLYDWSDKIPDAITSAAGAETFQGSLFDFVSSAEITVNETGSLTANTGNVTLTASTDQTHKLIDLLGGKLDSVLKLDQQPLNVKVGNANIYIYGKITAADSITASSKANVSIEASNASLASLYVPVAVVVAVTESGVDIIGAEMTARNGSVSATAESTSSIKAESTTGSLPVAISVAVAVNDAHVYVGDRKATEDSPAAVTKITAGKDVTLAANGSTNASASAKGGELNGNASGYIAAEVAVQDVSAEVKDAASITAGGDVNITSTANLKGAASAVSAKPGTGGSESGSEEQNDENSSVDGSLGSIKQMLTGIGTKLGQSGLNWVKVKLGLAADFVSSKAYKVSVGTTEHGSVSAPASANAHEAVTTKTFEAGVKYYTLDKKGNYVEDTTVKAGDPIPKDKAYYIDADPVRMVITPDKGYMVDTLTITYLKKGETQKTRHHSYKERGRFLQLRDAGQ